MLWSLHWLPVEYRIKFKTSVTTFSIRQFGDPAYLASLLHDKVSVRSLRSSDKSLLDVPRRRTETAKRSFSFSAPTIWNSLPAHLRQLDPITVRQLDLITVSQLDLITVSPTWPYHCQTTRPYHCQPNSTISMSAQLDPITVNQLGPYHCQFNSTLSLSDNSTLSLSRKVVLRNS